LPAVIDLLDPELHAREPSPFAGLPPVAWCPGRRGPGYFAVTGWAELCAAARDTDTFSSWWGTRPEVLRPPAALRPLHNLDGAAHASLRQIAAPLVAPARLDALPIRRLIDDTLGRFVRGDAMAGLCVPLAARLFADWLGPLDADRLVATVDEVHRAGAALLDTRADDPARSARAAAAQHATAALADWLDTGFAAAPPGSVLRHIADAPLARADAIALAALFVEAGMPTLIDALAAAIVELTPRPALAARLAGRPRERPLTVEELLRVGTPILQFARRARRDAVLGGVRIAAGQQVVLWFASANRDARVFAEPDVFAPLRAPNPHVAFGVGPHRCLGAPLARRALSAFVTAWCARVAVARPDGAWTRRPSSYQRGFVALPLAIEAR
jgi:cytochrome P450